MAGEKNLDALVGRTEYEVKRNGTPEAPNLTLAIDGSDTTVIRDGVITQNGLELYQYLEQELKKLEAALKEVKGDLIARIRSTGTATPVPKTKGKVVIDKAAVQDGRRLATVDVVTTETISWESVARSEAGIDDKDAMKAHVKTNLPEYVSQSERVSLVIK
jgi:hypothetical protein